MASDGKVTFEITADSSEAMAEIKKVVAAMKLGGAAGEKRFSGETTRGLTEIAGAAENTETSVNGLVETMTNFGTKAATVFSTYKIGQQIYRFGKESVNLASDLEEVQNVVDVTFGGGAETVNDWARSAAKSYGLTELQAKKYASTLGAMLKSSGMADDEIVQMSTDMAGLAADMASFYNLDFDDAFTKIMAGLSGETEPLKRLGVNMTVKNMEEFAKSMGLDTAYEKLSQAEQVALRIQYLMNSTADAQGDFARTADSYANSVRRFETNIDTLKANIGESLLPVITEATNAVNSFFESLLQTVPETALERIMKVGEQTSDRQWNMQNTAQEALGLVEAYRQLGDTVTDPALQGLVGEGLLGQMESLVPGISREAEKGADAMRDFVAAWAESQGVDIQIDDLAGKNAALSAAQKDLADAYTELLTARGKYEQASKIWNDAEASGDALNWFIKHQDVVDTLNQLYGTEGGTAAEWFYAIGGQITEAETQMEMAQQEVTRLGEAYTEAKAQVDAQAEAMGDVASAAEEAAEATGGFSEEALSQATEITGAVIPALEEMAEYYGKVRQSVEQAVFKTVSGFDMGNLVTEADKIRQQMEEWDEGSETYVNLSANLPTAENMSAALQEQLDYIDRYQTALQKVQEMGYNKDLIANFADGSTESLDYLEALAQGSDKLKDTINDRYEEVQQKRQEFVDSLTGATLDGDAGFQSLVDGVNTQLQALDSALGGSTAAASAAELVSGIAEAVAGQAPELEAQIAHIADLLEQLSSLNLSGGGYSSPFVGEYGPVIPGYATGLDYVPNDNFLAYLHEGESVLTAEEAKVWRNFKYGGTSSANSIDYGALSGAIWDNAPKMGGGNVYLDGQTVGRVLSAQQANSLKTLQRSGWQG